MRFERLHPGHINDALFKLRPRGHHRGTWTNKRTSLTFIYKFTDELEASRDLEGGNPAAFLASINLVIVARN